jgi:hypothetical protein
MLEPTCEYDEGDVYYGHTATTLVKRLSEHKRPASKLKSSKYLMDKYGRDNIKIVLMELCPCSCKDELKAVEAKYQRENKCVNKNIAGRTRPEWEKDNRATRNPQHVASAKKRRENMTDEEMVEYKKVKSQRDRKHYLANREKILSQVKAYSAKKKSLHNV